MSTEWNFKCITCDQECEESTSVKEAFIELHEIWPLVEKVGQTAYFEVKSLIGYSLIPSMGFLQHHRSHEIVLRSEYGNEEAITSVCKSLYDEGLKAERARIAAYLEKLIKIASSGEKSVQLVGLLAGILTKVNEQPQIPSGAEETGPEKWIYTRYRV